MIKPKISFLITIIIFKNIHCYDISIKTLKFTPVYRLFSFNIIEKIEFYVINSHYDTSII